MPREVREETRRITRALEHRTAGVGWVPPQNVHLTVAFLGRTSFVDRVRAAARAAAASRPPFELRTAGLGAFPSPGRARVLWVGIAGEVEAFRATVAAVWAELEPLGFEPEAREQSPHLTIGRLRMPARVDLSGVEVAEMPIPVESLVVYESHLRRPAPVYEDLETVPLGG